MLNVTYPCIPASALPHHTPPSSQSSSPQSSSSSLKSIVTPTELSNKQQDQFGSKYNQKRMFARSDGSDGGDTLTRSRHTSTSTKKASNNQLTRSAPLFLTHGKSDLAVSAAAITQTTSASTTLDTNTTLPNTDQPPSSISSQSTRYLLQTHTALESKLASIHLKNNREKSASNRPKVPPTKHPKPSSIFDLWQCPSRPPILIYPTPSIQVLTLYCYMLCNTMQYLISIHSLPALTTLCITHMTLGHLHRTLHHNKLTH